MTVYAFYHQTAINVITFDIFYKVVWWNFLHAFPALSSPSPKLWYCFCSSGGADLLLLVLWKTFQLQTSFYATELYCSLASVVSFVHTQANEPSRSDVSGMIAIAAIYYIAQLFVNPSVLFVWPLCCQINDIIVIFCSWVSLRRVACS